MKNHRARVAFSLTAFAMLAVAGCNAEKKEFEGLCHLNERAAGAAVLTPAQLDEAMSAWMADNIKSPSVISAIGAINMNRGIERGSSLRGFAKAGGYDGPCPYADKMTADAQARQAAQDAAVAGPAADVTP